MSNEVAEKRTEVEFKPAQLRLVNKAQLMEWATGIRNQYKKMENLRSTPETLKGDTAVLKDLNSKRKDLENARLEIQREFKKPLDEFNADVKDAVAIIDEAIEPIKTAVDDEEARQREEKRQEIIGVAKEIFDQYEVDINDLEFNKRWLNKTFKEKQREQEIIDQAMVLRASKAELARNAEAVQNLALNRQLEPEAFIQQIYNDIPLAKVMQNVDQAAKQAEERKERDERLEIARKAQEEAQMKARTTTVGDKRIDNETGEVVEEFRSFRFTAKLSMKQAKSLKFFLDEHRIDYEVEGV
jgi:hypothetical protein